MDNNTKKSAFPVEILDAIVFKKKVADSQVFEPSIDQPMQEAQNETQSEDQNEDQDKDQSGVDQQLETSQDFSENLSDFLSKKDDSPSREEKVQRAETLGLI